METASATLSAPDSPAAPARCRAALLPASPADPPDALDQRRLHDDPADERPQHLQCAPGAVLGAGLDVRPAVGLDRRREHADRADRQDAHRRPRLRDDRRARPVRGRRRAGGARVPELGHDSRRAVARDGASLAPLLRLALRDQRHRLRALQPVQPAPGARPDPDEGRAAADRRVDPRPRAVPPPDRRGGEALQRAAEPRLPRSSSSACCR